MEVSFYSPIVVVAVVFIVVLDRIIGSVKLSKEVYCSLVI